VEGLVGYSRRHFMVPLPVADDFDALNAQLLDGWPISACRDWPQSTHARSETYFF